MAADRDAAAARPAAEPVQRIAQAVLVAALLLLGLWIIHAFLAALAWAAVFFIALSPAYRRLIRASGGRGRRMLAPLAVTSLIGLVFVVPVIYVVVAAAHETATVMRYLGEARHSGVPAPDWLSRLPGVGVAAADWWRANLADPQATELLLGRIYTQFPAATARQIGADIVHRVTLFAITLLVLVFLFRDGEALERSAAVD